MQKTKDIKEQIGKDLVRDIRSLKPFITALTEFQVGMVEAKQIIIDGLNKAKSRYLIFVLHTQDLEPMHLHKFNG